MTRLLKFMVLLVIVVNFGESEIDDEKRRKEEGDETDVYHSKISRTMNNLGLKSGRGSRRSIESTSPPSYLRNGRGE